MEFSSSTPREKQSKRNMESPTTVGFHGSADNTSSQRVQKSQNVPAFKPKKRKSDVLEEELLKIIKNDEGSQKVDPDKPFLTVCITIS